MTRNLKLYSYHWYQCIAKFFHTKSVDSVIPAPSEQPIPLRHQYSHWNHFVTYECHSVIKIIFTTSELPQWISCSYLYSLIRLMSQLTHWLYFWKSSVDSIQVLSRVHRVNLIADKLGIILPCRYIVCIFQCPNLHDHDIHDEWWQFVNQGTAQRFESQRQHKII